MTDIETAQVINNVKRADEAELRQLIYKPTIGWSTVVEKKERVIDVVCLGHLYSASEERMIPCGDRWSLIGDDEVKFLHPDSHIEPMPILELRWQDQKLYRHVAEIMSVEEEGCPDSWTLKFSEHQDYPKRYMPANLTEWNFDLLGRLVPPWSVRRFPAINMGQGQFIVPVVVMLEKRLTKHFPFEDLALATKGGG